MLSTGLQRKNYMSIWNEILSRCLTPVTSVSVVSVWSVGISSISVSTVVWVSTISVSSVPSISIGFSISSGFGSWFSSRLSIPLSISIESISTIWSIVSRVSISSIYTIVSTISTINAPWVSFGISLSLWNSKCSGNKSSDQNKYLHVCFPTIAPGLPM